MFVWALGGAAAYIDPAATSILLASITSVVVAIGATFIVLWRKFKKGVSKTLHIDPNAGKEVEDDLVVHDETESQDAQPQTELSAQAQPAIEKEENEEKTE